MRILAVDDDPDILDILREALPHHGIEAEVASSGKEGLKRAREDLFDMVLMDVDLPDLSGFDVVRKLRDEGVTVPIMMLTAMTAEEDIVTGLESGADGYMTKPFSIRELSARMKALKRRTESNRATVLRFGDLTLNAAERAAQRGETLLRLTETEFRILAYFVNHPNTDVTRSDLLEEVWAMDFDPGTGIVDVHVGNLRKKLRAAGPPLIQTVRGVGFRLG